MEFNHDLKSFDNIFLGFDNKNKLKNYIKLNKNNIKFFINLKIYSKLKGENYVLYIHKRKKITSKIYC